MPRGKKFTAEQIIGKLREAEVGLAQGKTVPEVVRKLGVTEQMACLGIWPPQQNLWVNAGSGNRPST